jgi:hypothetical protein
VHDFDDVQDLDREQVCDQKAWLTAWRALPLSGAQHSRTQATRTRYLGFRLMGRSLTPVAATYEKAPFPVKGRRSGGSPAPPNSRKADGDPEL